MRVGVRLLPLALALCLAPAGARAASPPGVQWVADLTPAPSRSYPVNSVQRLGDGSVLVVESMFFAGVVATHLDADGTVLSTHELPLPDIYDGSLKVSIDSFGSVFVGLTATPRPLEAWVMKFDGLTGSPLWPGPFHYRPDPATDTLFRALAVDARGNLFITGLAASQTGVTFIFSLDGATGGIIWGPTSYVDAATPGLTFLHVVADANGDAVASGSWEDTAGTQGQLAAFKFDGRTGVPLWGPVLVPAGTTGPDTARYAALDPSGNLVVAGERTDGALYRPIVVKIAGADGSVLWGPVLPTGTGTNFAAVTLLLIDAGGDVFVGARLPGGDVPTLVKLAGPDGSVAWGPIPYPGNASASPFPIAAVVAPNGDLVATFSERTSNPVTHSAVTVRIDGGTGAVLWGPAALATAGVSGGLLLDTGGSFLLAVTTIDPQNSNVVGRPEVVFLSGATGATIRGPFNLPPGARFARPVKIAVDLNGDVVALGTLSPDGLTGPAALVKYRGATGAILWGPVEVPLDAGGLPVDLKLAANGDPIWIGTGQSPTLGTGGLVLSRFSGATGAVLWGPVVFTRAYATALALDANGDVFALGNTVLLKCDGATGGLLWGPVATPNPGADSLRVGPTGDVVVAGWYSGSDVARYRGSNGALVWGPVPVSASYPQALAIDAAGDVFLSGGGDVMKLRGVDGTTAWGPVTAVDLAGGFSAAAALALDPAGNPVAEVFTYDGVTSRRAAVLAKLDNSSGSRLWGPVTWDAGEGPAPQDPVLLALDPSGDVIVAANGVNDAYLDLVVRKYSGANGSALWGPVTFDGPGTNYLLDMALIGSDPVLAGAGFPGSMRTVRFGFGLSLETQAWQLPPALCGEPYTFRFQSRNGTPPPAFSVTGGALPAGLVLDATTGRLAGVTGPAGSYPFRLRVANATSSVERDFTLVVVEGQPVVDVHASPAAVCSGSSASLSVSGTYASYLWQPGGATTASVTVSPASSMAYEFLGTTSTGCVRRGSRLVTVLPRPGTPAISAPSSVPSLAPDVAASVPDHPGSSFAWNVTGGALLSGQGSHEIHIAAGVSGDLTLTVVETGPNGCAAPGATFTGTVIPVPTAFVPLVPCRLYDSRVSGSPLAPAEVRRLTLAGSCGLPSSARAVTLNVTAVGVSGSGTLSVAPGGTTEAARAGPSWKDANVRAASAIAALSGGGAIDVTCASSGGSAHVVIDVSGYFE